MSEVDEVLGNRESWKLVASNTFTPTTELSLSSRSLLVCGNTGSSVSWSYSPAPAPPGSQKSGCLHEIFQILNADNNFKLNKQTLYGTNNWSADLVLRLQGLTEAKHLKT